MFKHVIFVSVILMALAFVSCQSESSVQGTYPAARSMAFTAMSASFVKDGSLALPKPLNEGGESLDNSLAHRRSVREFTPDPVSLEQLSQLVWAAQGVTIRKPGFSGRTAPAAGGFHSLDLYVFLPIGMFVYQPDNHSLKLIKDGDQRESLMQSALGQSWVGSAAAVFVVAGRLREDAVAKYGERMSRYVMIEAGCATQNLLLEAAALGLGSVPVGAFNDEKTAEVLGSDEEGPSPLMIVPVGRILNK